MPKNIVICSDGTGNSAKVVNITHVRRLYLALDLSEPANQIAFYDDGVGTGNRFMRIVGGALGLGLARNVRGMYQYLCEVYRPGDRLFLFGFSRGAFTVRILAAFIKACGILDPAKSEQTRQFGGAAGYADATKIAYRAFRRSLGGAIPALLWDGLRWLVGLQAIKACQIRAGWSHEQAPRIEVLGLWDTVSAYGMPINELSLFVNWLIYRIKFETNAVGGNVGAIFHALAIDDERETFTPLLVEGAPNNCDLRQVWFAGMHSDVGGGYANNNLALVTLDWMFDCLDTRHDRLIFRPGAVDALRRQASAFGEMNDSRAGLAAFYRPKPRNIACLCGELNKHNPELHPVVDPSVIQRIGAGVGTYAPIALPRRFTIRGQPAPDVTQVETTRIAAFVTWWRVTYFAAVIMLVGLVATVLGPQNLAVLWDGLPVIDEFADDIVKLLPRLKTAPLVWAAGLLGSLIAASAINRHLRDTARQGFHSPTKTTEDKPPTKKSAWAITGSAIEKLLMVPALALLGMALVVGALQLGRGGWERGWEMIRWFLP